MSATWTVALGILASAGILVSGVLVKVFVHLVSEEVEGRLDQLGYAVLRLACKRLPEPLREGYYQEWAAELDAHFQGAAERPLTRLYWSLRFPVPLVFRAQSFARIQDPTAFGDPRDPVAELFSKSRSARLGFAGVIIPAFLVVLLQFAFEDGSPLFKTVVAVGLAALVGWMCALSLLMELVSEIEDRRGSKVFWARYVDAAMEFTLWMHHKVGSMPRSGVAHLYRLARGKTRQDKVSSRIP